VARNSTSVGRTNVMNNVSGRRVALPRDMRVRGYPAYQEEPEQVPKIWPDPDFIEEVMAAFPDKGVANVEEGRCLYEEGYQYLDVRSKPEVESDGQTPRAVNIPLIDTVRKWNLSVSPAELEVTQTANPKFMEQIKEAFPDKDTPILVVCSDGTQRAIQVLMLLDAEGYTNIVGLKGGFIEWNFFFKPYPKQNRIERRGQTVKYSTVYTADGDALGVHTTGAGFTPVDKVDMHIDSVDMQTWIKWEDAVKASA